MRPWKTLDRQTILDHSKYLIIENHTVALPAGRIVPDWPWVITPNFVNVVAITEAGRFVCLRQTKYAVEGVSLGVAGGYIEPGEDPLLAAQRELLEETGYQARRWTGQGQFPVDGNRGAGTAHLFLAQDAYLSQDPDADDLEEQEVVLLGRAEVATALVDGEFKVLSWATSIALALLHTGD